MSLSFVFTGHELPQKSFDKLPQPVISVTHPHYPPASRQRSPGAASLAAPGETAAQCSRNTCAGARSPLSRAGRTEPLAALQSSPASQGPQSIRHLSGTRRDWKNAGPSPSFLTESGSPPSSVSGLCTAHTDAAGGLGQQILSLVHSFSSVASNL